MLANPYPLYSRLRREAPVHWDPYLHAWIVTRYEDVITVLTQFSAETHAPTPSLRGGSIPEVAPIAKVMIKQMLFRDGPAHARLRKLAGGAFMPARVRVLHEPHSEITAARLVTDIRARGNGRFDLLADFAEPLPAIVTAEMLGVPTEDHVKLKNWSATFSKMLISAVHPDRLPGVLATVECLTAYFQKAVNSSTQQPREGLIDTLLNSEENGDRLSDEEVIANCIVTMVGGLETTTNLIGNGMLSLLRNPEHMLRLRAEPELMPVAVEELLRCESPSQTPPGYARRYDARRQGDPQAAGEVIAVMAAGNRDPEAAFPDPDRLDFDRPDNRLPLTLWLGGPLLLVLAAASWPGLKDRSHLTTFAPRLPRSCR